LVGEWPWLGTRQRQRANRLALSQERNGEVCAILTKFLPGEVRVFPVGKNIGNMYRFALESHPPDGCPTSWRDWMTLVILSKFARIIIVRRTSIDLTLSAK